MTEWLKLSALCAASEQCIHDVRKKMQRWELTEEQQQSIIDRLVKEKYIDENRYAHAFVRDKSRYNRWGAVKIKNELRKRNISSHDIKDALTELSDDDTLETLRQLIDKKRPTVKGRSEYEINAKLIRFALSRGFEMKDILKVLKSELPLPFLE